MHRVFIDEDSSLPVLETVQHALSGQCQGAGHDDYQDQAQQGRETLLETRRVLHLCVDLGKLLVVLKVVGQKNY